MIKVNLRKFYDTGDRNVTDFIYLIIAYCYYITLKIHLTKISNGYC